MNHHDEDTYDEADDTGQEFMIALREFFTAYKDDIGGLIRAFAKNIEEGPRTKFRGMLVVFAMLAFIVIILTVLAFEDIVSGESIVFLVGAIVGYLFSFLRHYVVGIGA